MQKDDELVPGGIPLWPTADGNKPGQMTHKESLQFRAAVRRRRNAALRSMWRTLAKRAARDERMLRKEHPEWFKPDFDPATDPLMSKFLMEPGEVQCPGCGCSFKLEESGDAAQ